MVLFEQIWKTKLEHAFVTQTDRQTGMCYLYAKNAHNNCTLSCLFANCSLINTASICTVSPMEKVLQIIISTYVLAHIVIDIWLEYVLQLCYIKGLLRGNLSKISLWRNKIEVLRLENDETEPIQKRTTTLTSFLYK